MIGKKKGTVYIGYHKYSEFKISIKNYTIRKWYENGKIKNDVNTLKEITMFFDHLDICEETKQKLLSSFVKKGNAFDAKYFTNQIDRFNDDILWVNVFTPLSNNHYCYDVNYSIENQEKKIVEINIPINLIKPIMNEDNITLKWNKIVDLIFPLKNKNEMLSKFVDKCEIAKTLMSLTRHEFYNEMLLKDVFNFRPSYVNNKYLQYPFISLKKEDINLNKVFDMEEVKVVV